MGRTRTTAVALAAAAAAALGVLSGPPAGAAPASGHAAAARGPAQQVTLLTGDRVLVRPGAPLSIRPAAGREHLRFASYTDHGDTYVVPADATARLARGTVDRRLFDVTALLANGYGDAARDDIPLLVTHAGTAGAAARTRVAAAGATEVRALPGARVSTLTAQKRAATRLWDSLTAAPTARTAAPVDKVWLDGKVKATLDVSVPQIGAPAAWAAGHTGAGTTVAILDTGLDAGHPDLAGAVAGSQDFTETGSTADDNGHGTHVASIVTGSGAASGGRYKGVAPDTKLLVGKVLDAYGSGYDSWILAGMEWAATQHADVVNMSLGSPWPDDGTDPMSEELDRLTRETGTLFVVAAGNSGPYDTSIGSPGSADEALTVGAVDSTDAIADFSSRGPRYGDGAIKPDITAPGVDIVAAKAAGSTLGEPVGDSYQRLSGTSMATPHVAGAAAILAGEHPAWTAEQLKAALMNSAKPTAGATVDQQGAGRVDVARATTQHAYATPASLSEGTAQWPHQDDPTITRTVTYHNDGSAPLTLALDLAVTGPTGAAAPAGMFGVSPATLTVPAHGTAAATLTTRTTVTAPDGRYGGALVATGGSTVLRTPVAVTREVESYDVTLTVIDRQGRPTPNYFTRFVSLTAEQAVIPYDESGTVTARIPKGRYYMDSWVQPAVYSEDPAVPIDLYTFAEPTVVVTGDFAITLDARTARPVGLTAQRPAAAGQSAIAISRTTEWGGTGTAFFGYDFTGQYVKPSRTTAPADQFRFDVSGVLARPDGHGGFTGSPYLYHLGYTARGRIPANLVRRFADRGLGVSHTSLVGAAPGLIGVKDYVVPVALPGRLTELFTPGLDWYGDLSEFVPPYDPYGSPVAYQTATSPSRYAKGRVTAERWGRPVLGPSFPDDGIYGPTVGRLGDLLVVDPSLYSDAAGHAGYLESTGTVELYRDGQPVAAEYPGYWTVPAEPASYRAVFDLTSAVPGSVSSAVTVAWTFRSGHVAGDVPAALPALAVRFRPAVDDRNTARGGRAFEVPVSVQKQPGARYGRVGAPTVQVSYDEGATWAKAPVVHGKVRLRHPAGPGSVSLRATVADSAGNTVEQTVIRAYLLR